MLKKFERHLREKNLSKNTISSYIFAVKQFIEKFGDHITQKKLRDYKVWLIENFKPKTVNLRLGAINSFLESIGKEKWNIQLIKIQQKTFLENVISKADYEFLKNSLKKDNEIFWYFVVRFLGATGARISEFVQFKVEHVKMGYLDLYSNNYLIFAYD